MGMQGPLAAAALGRSPYDEVFDGTGEKKPHEPTQDYDSRGRPVNANTKRLNRDLIRAHNEVMLVIGVAEPENPQIGPEADMRRRHIASEDKIGNGLEVAAALCVQAVGVFGVDGARQRILLYKRYSHIRFWDFYAQARQDFSIRSMLLPGSPSAWVANIVESLVIRWWPWHPKTSIPRTIFHEVWAYLRVHLELFATLQRVGILETRQWFPSLSFFLPFSENSPVPSPGPLTEYSASAVAEWLLFSVLCASPFLLWVFARRMSRDWKGRLSPKIFRLLPTTIPEPKPPHMLPTRPSPPPLTPLPLSTTPHGSSSPERPNGLEGASSSPSTGVDSGSSGINNDASSTRTVRRQALGEENSMGSTRQQSAYSNGGDDESSGEEDNDGLNATLISFDVEATDSAEAPTGLWSAELRPSSSLEPRQHKPAYLATRLNSMPSRFAASLLANSFVRVAVAPYEAIALRRVASIMLLRNGLPTDDLLTVNPFEGLNLTSIVNFLVIEFLHLSLSGEIWAIATRLSQYLYRTEAEFEDYEMDLRLEAPRSETRQLASTPGVTPPSG